MPVPRPSANARSWRRAPPQPLPSHPPVQGGGLPSAGSGGRSCRWPQASSGAASATTCLASPLLFTSRVPPARSARGVSSRIPLASQPLPSGGVPVSVSVSRRNDPGSSENEALPEPCELGCVACVPCWPVVCPLVEPVEPPPAKVVNVSPDVSVPVPEQSVPVVVPPDPVSAEVLVVPVVPAEREPADPPVEPADPREPADPPVEPADPPWSRPSRTTGRWC